MTKKNKTTTKKFLCLFIALLLSANSSIIAYALNGYASEPPAPVWANLEAYEAFRSQGMTTEERAALETMLASGEGVMYFDPVRNRFYHLVDGLHYYPAFDLYYCPVINRWFAPNLEMLPEGHGFVNINDLPLVPDTWPDDDTSSAAEMHIMPTIDCPVHTAMEALGMTHEDVNAFLTSLPPSWEMTRAHFDTFYALNLGLSEYQNVRARASGRDWAAFEAFLFRSGLTLSEFVAGLLLLGYSPADIDAFIEQQLAHNLDNRGFSFMWDATPVYEEGLDDDSIAASSGNLPTPTISTGAATATSIELSGTIISDGGTSTFAVGNTQYLLNDQIRTALGTPFIDPATDRMMIPLRTLSEALGVNVEWDSANRAALVHLPTGTLAIPADAMLPDGMGSVIIVNNRIFVPLRFVMYAYDADVEWDSVGRAAVITW